MTTILKGTVIKGKIILKDLVDLPDGTEVDIIPPAKYRILRHAGVWKDWDNIDALIKEIYDSRTVSGREVNL